MKILVTGGAGYVGRRFVRQFASCADLTVVDKLLYADEYMEPVKFMYGDVADVNFMSRILPEFDVVVHLAGIVGDAACSIRPDETQRANVDSVQILADYFGGRIIWASSCSVYGASNKISTEKSKVNPLSLYAETKVKAEEILKKKNAICLRLGTLHGVSERPRFDIVVNTLVARALVNKEISVCGGNQWRPLLGLNDLTRLIFQIIDAPQQLVGIFNVSGQNLRIIDIATKVAEMIPGTLIRTTVTKFEDSRNYRVATKKIQKAYNFEPIHLIDKTINDIKQLHLEGRVKCYSNLKYSNMVRLNFK